MNIIENQMKLGRELFELNTAWFRKFAEFDGDSFRKYVELNREYVERLPEVRDPQSFFELQRNYGEQLWQGTQETMQARGEMVREALEEAGSAVRRSWTQEEAEVEAA